MKDSHGRDMRYLRISITDRCNLRCNYCMPESGVQNLPHEEILRFGEIERIARIMADLGVSRIRLTGGEPLVRQDLPQLVAQLKRIPGIDFLGLTTNGTLLAPIAGDLRRAGLDGLNISLDTLDPKRYHDLTRRGNLRDALDGLDAALAQGYPSVKINCVLAPNSIPGDWLGVAALAKELPVDVRFIEWMPMAGETGFQGVGGDEVQRELSLTYGQAQPLENSGDGGPARYWRFDGFAGRIGLIDAMSHRFCAQCNRLRLTSTGDLKLCLFYDAGVALKTLLRGGADDKAIASAIENAVLAKPKEHIGAVVAAAADSAEASIAHMQGMYQTGG